MKLNKFFDKLFKIIPGGVFGLLSVSIGICIDIIGLVISRYSIFTHSVSSLGIGPVGLFFNIGLILSGINAVIFDIYLGKSINREFVNDKLIKIMIAISISSSTSLILVGVFPLSQNNEIILVLHVIFAFISFIGGLIFLFIFSLFIGKDPNFLKIQSYVGFVVCGFFTLYLFTLIPITQWMAVFAIILWTIINASYMIYKKI